MSTQRAKHAILSWEVICACLCFAGGIGAGLAGTTLSALAWIMGAQLHPWLHGLGTTLLVVTIPLLIFSGYCLDWMDREQTQTQTTAPNNAGSP